MQEGGYRSDDTLGSRIGCMAMLPVVWIGMSVAAEEGSHGHVPGGPFTLMIAWLALSVAAFFGLRSLVRRFLFRP